MSNDAPLKPENVPQLQLTEAEETKVLNYLEETYQNLDPRTSITKSMMDLKASLVEKGMSVDLIHRFIGQIYFYVPAALYGTLFYQKHLEIASENIVRIHKLFLQEFNEQVFIDKVKEMKFIVQPPHAYLELIEAMEREKGGEGEE